MVPNTYHPYFGGCAAVAGTLIGLLFVAISVSPHKDIGKRAPLIFQIQAGVAFTALLDALIIALAALLPRTNLGDASLLFACTGISSTIGIAVISLRERPKGRQFWGLAIIPLSGIVYMLQLLNGITMLTRPNDAGSVNFQALLLLILFIVAIVRAWQMIGGRDTRVTAVLGDVLRNHKSLVLDPENDGSGRCDNGSTETELASASAQAR
jgi:drug/metabolite transporter (DMT)-like permease